MSTGRTLWIVFCCGMAAVWFVLGFAFILPWLLVPLSLLAILLPVGKPQPRRLPTWADPLCMTCRWPFSAGHSPACPWVQHGAALPPGRRPS